MRVFYDPACLAHAPPHEFSRGRLIPYREAPRRAEVVRTALEAAGFGPMEHPAIVLGGDGAGGVEGEESLGMGGMPLPSLTDDTGLPDISDPRLDAVLSVHDAGFVGFLMTAWSQWIAADPSRMGNGTEADPPVYAIPTAWALPEVGHGWPTAVEAQLGLYCFDSATPIGPETWGAVLASARTAEAAARALLAAPAFPTFALCRPPGHHAGASLLGGYCYLNNAAIAAQCLVDGGVGKVAILDVDYHHGNGTQSIFWEREDVLYASLHADPDAAFPYFSGHRDETGAGPGEGMTVNLPLGAGVEWGEYGFALDHALAAISRFGADALVVSVGVDVWEGDPLSGFGLAAGDFPRIGAALARAGLPTVLVMEGGYAQAETGDHVAAVLSGFVG